MPDYICVRICLRLPLSVCFCLCALLTMSRKQQCDIACNISMDRGNNFPRHHIAFKRSNFLLIYLRKRIHFVWIDVSFLSLPLPLKPSLSLCLCLRVSLVLNSIPFKLWFSACSRYHTFDAERILLSINSYLTKIKLKSHGRKIIDYNAKRETTTKKKIQK